MMMHLILENVSPTTVGIAVTTVLITIAYYFFKTRGLPPGPTGLPLVGYWPFLNSPTGHLKLAALKKKYGDVFSFTCTGTLYINLGSHRAVREAHITKSDCFSSKNSNFNLLAQVFEGGIIFSKGEVWKLLRKLFLQVFKEKLSMKHNTLESVYESMNDLVVQLRSKTGDPVDIIEPLMSKCTTFLRLTLFGGTGTTNEKIREINALYVGVVGSMSSSNLLLTGNISKYLIFPLKPEYRLARKCLKQVDKLLHEMIEEHKSTYDEENIRDFIDEYIKERKGRSSKGDPMAKYLTDKALKDSLSQFVGDSVSSVAHVICVFIKCLLDHPEEQEKIYEELVEVVGIDRQPTLDDKSKLVYLNAFLLETLRTSDFFPYFPTLECTKETTLNGYRIPKGAVTIRNCWSAHFDPAVYEEPEKFKPSRYISKDGRKKSELPITFGVGKRSCLGEGYVMLLVFLSVATLVKNFCLTVPEEVSDVHEGKMYIKPRS